MKHWERFKDLNTTTQTFVVSKHLDVPTFEGWVKEIASNQDNPREVATKSILFVEKGAEELDDMLTSHKHHLPDREIEVVRDIDTHQIKLMVEYTREFNTVIDNG